MVKGQRFRVLRDLVNCLYSSTASFGGFLGCLVGEKKGLRLRTLKVRSERGSFLACPDPTVKDPHHAPIC